MLDTQYTEIMYQMDANIFASRIHATYVTKCSKIQLTSNQETNKQKVQCPQLLHHGSHYAMVKAVTSDYYVWCRHTIRTCRHKTAQCSVLMDILVPQQDKIVATMHISLV